VRLEGGSWLTLDVCWRADRAEPAFGYEIVGELGTARLDPLSVCVQRDGQLVEVLDRGHADTDWNASVRRGLREVVSALRSGESPPTTVNEALMIQAITDGVYASAAAGREVVVKIS
jgi:predicted dehydrogenase